MNTSRVKTIFLSTPLSAFTKVELGGFVSWCKVVERSLSENLNAKIYCAALLVESFGNFDSEHQSVVDDFTAIDDSSVFILIYPEKLATSALIELGYAVAKKKPILIIAKKKTDLPFLAKGLPKAFSSVEIFISDAFSSSVVDKIIEFSKPKI